jgi:hypothetical protein
MNPFFRIGLAMAMIVCVTPCVQGGRAGAAAGAAIAFRAAKNNNNNQTQPTAVPAAVQPQQAAAPAPAAAPTGLAAMQTTGQLIAIPLTKMQIIIKTVTSCKYPFWRSAFAGDYCQPQCSVICAPPV